MANFLKEYTILAELGQGGFAKVYKVRHNALGYIRAIRVLSEPVTDESSRTYQKFLRECKVLLRLGNGCHRNIVHIYQPRLLENHALVEMDYVDGKDLTHYLQDNGNFLPADEVLRMVEQMSSALAYCHEDIYRFCMDPDEDQLENDPIDGSKWIIDEAKRQQLIEKYKVIHNDIHSGNIMRREDGSFVLLDFGLAITGGDDVRNSSRHDNGAVEYKAPEKWDDEALLTEQSDIYSFGVVMYEYLAGRVPFPFDKTIPNRTEATFKVCKAHKEQVPPPIFDLRRACFEAKHPGRTYEKDYPEWLEAAIMKCLEKDPAKRFRNGKDLHEFVMQHLAEQEHSGSPLQVAYVPKTEEQAQAEHLDNGTSEEEQPKPQERQGIEDVRAEKHEPKEEEQTPSAPPEPRPLESRPVAQKAATDKPQGRKGLWIVIAIVALAAVAALLFLLRPKSEPKSADPDTLAFEACQTVDDYRDYMRDYGRNALHYNEAKQQVDAFVADSIAKVQNQRDENNEVNAIKDKELNQISEQSEESKGAEPVKPIGPNDPNIQFKKDFWDLIHQRTIMMDPYDALFKNYKGKVSGEEYDYLRYNILKDVPSFKLWTEQLRKVSASDLQSISTINDLKAELEKTQQSPKQSLTGSANGHEWVDLGLPSGTLWATCNVGASKPEGYGDYYAWGETSTKSIYEWGTYKYANGDGHELTKYCNKSDWGYKGFVDNLTTLEAGDDAAIQLWGSGWHTPDYVQWNELLSNTTNEWTMRNGVNGLLFTSKRNGQTLFLPAAGYRWGSELSYAGSYGGYWSREFSLGVPGGGLGLEFSSDKCEVNCRGGRPAGNSVRPVRSARQNQN